MNQQNCHMIALKLAGINLSAEPNICAGQGTLAAFAARVTRHSWGKKKKNASPGSPILPRGAGKVRLYHTLLNLSWSLKRILYNRDFSLKKMEKLYWGKKKIIPPMKPSWFRAFADVPEGRNIR